MQDMVSSIWNKIMSECGLNDWLVGGKSKYVRTFTISFYCLFSKDLVESTVFQWINQFILFLTDESREEPPSPLQKLLTTQEDLHSSSSSSDDLDDDDDDTALLDEENVETASLDHLGESPEVHSIDSFPDNEAFYKLFPENGTIDGTPADSDSHWSKAADSEGLGAENDEEENLESTENSEEVEGEEEETTGGKDMEENEADVDFVRVGSGVKRSRGDGDVGGEEDEEESRPNAKHPRTMSMNGMAARPAITMNFIGMDWRVCRTDGRRFFAFLRCDFLFLCAKQKFTKCVLCMRIIRSFLSSFKLFSICCHPEVLSFHRLLVCSFDWFIDWCKVKFRCVFLLCFWGALMMMRLLVTL